MRIIDADQYAVEMKMRQDAVQASIEHPRAGRYYTDMEHWQGVMLAFVEAKLTMDNMPTIDAAPVVHGLWRGWNYPGDEHVECSICKTQYYEDDLYIGGNDFPNYCPNCGAKMDLEGLNAEKED